jgi:hypothetical protein
MDTIRYLLGAVLKLAIILFIAALAFWIFRFFFPDIKVESTSKSFYSSFAEIFSFDWLPAPKQYGGLLGNRSGVNAQEYVPGPAYNGYANAAYNSDSNVDWVYYTTSGTKVVRGGSSGTQTSTTGTSRLNYIRNLSVYEGMSITNGQIIYGEVRDIMVKNGSFPIAVADQNGHLVSSTQGFVLSTWSAPGWVRFQATIRTQLPSGIYCNLVFYSANESNFRIVMPVMCK